MIAKKVKDKPANRSSFAKLINYLANEQGKQNRVEEYWTANLNETKDLELATIEVTATQSLNTRTKQDKTYHLIFSFPENEIPDNETLKKIEQRLVDKLGYSEHQRISFIHKDTDNVHVHVAINKIHPESKNCVTPLRDYKLLQEARRNCEKDFNLRKTDLKIKASQKQSEFEEVNSIESLITYSRENCTTNLATADSWESLHQELHEHGLMIKERGNGMILSTLDNSLSIKLSSVDRNFTKKKLIDRLGDFQALDKSKLKNKQSKKEYKKKPTDKRKEANKLYQEYLQRKHNLYDDRKKVFADINDKQNRELDSFWQSYKIKTAMLMPFRKNLLVQITFKMMSKNRNFAINKIKDKYKKQRQDCYNKYTVGSWVEFLQNEAMQGNKTALDILRKRNQGQINETEKTNSIQHQQSSFDDTSLKNKIDTITKHGTILINGKDDCIKVKKDIVTVGNNPSLKAINECLEISINKFGKENLNLHGTVEYKASVLYLASQRQLKLSFEDEKINKIYKMLLEEQRKKNDKSNRRQLIKRTDEYFGFNNESRGGGRTATITARGIERKSTGLTNKSIGTTGDNRNKSSNNERGNDTTINLTRIENYRRNQSRKVTPKRTSLPILPKSNLERYRKSIRVLLHTNVFNKLSNRKQKDWDKNHLRWNVHDSRMKHQSAIKSRENNKKTTRKHNTNLL